MLTHALVDYAFTLLGHALTRVVKLGAFCLFLKRRWGEVSKQQTLPQFSIYMSQSNRGSRWLLVPSRSPTVICLWRRRSALQNVLSEKRGRIQWGKESPVHILSLCPDRIKYFLVWGWVRVNTPEASWSLLCPCQKRGVHSCWEEPQRWDGHQGKKSKQGEEEGSIQQLRSPQGVDGCWHTRGSVGSCCTGSSSATVDSRQPVQHHCTVLCSHRVLGLCMH